MSKKSKPYSCFLISNKPNLVKEVTKNLKKETVTYFDGTNVSSFSKLVNSCVLQAPSETVIIMSDKMRPTDENIQRTLDLLDEGYAFVGLYRFGFSVPLLKYSNGSCCLFGNFVSVTNEVLDVPPLLI